MDQDEYNTGNNEFQKGEQPGESRRLRVVDRTRRHPKYGRRYATQNFEQQVRRWQYRQGLLFTMALWVNAPAGEAQV
jgi:hypothetical protein